MHHQFCDRFSAYVVCADPSATSLQKSKTMVAARDICSRCRSSWMVLQPWHHWHARSVGPGSTESIVGEVCLCKHTCRQKSRIWRFAEVILQQQSTLFRRFPVCTHLSEENAACRRQKIRLRTTPCEAQLSIPTAQHKGQIKSVDGS